MIYEHARRLEKGAEKLLIKQSSLQRDRPGFICVHVNTKNFLYLSLTMYRHHIYVCVVLIVLALPVFLLDSHLLKSKGGNWISLDFRGALIWTYAFFLIAHILISSLALKFFADTNLARVHIGSGFAAIVLMVAGFTAYNRVQRSSDRRQYEERQARRKLLRDVIELKSWWYVPDVENPAEIHVSVHVSKSGRFSGNVEGREEGENGKQIFTSTDVLQRQVSTGENFVHVFPVKRWNQGKAKDISITLYLFKDESGSAVENISKIFIKDPERDDDGHFFYAKLPPPSKVNAN